ncbi:MAG: arabinoxylan arabinofuranohydrolase, partial [Bacillota bacterium]|nr:arabinoxylan arabinofuranohydrolase [Bacillota bacterium]
MNKNAYAKIPGYSNPLITHKYGADPYALVYDGRVYIYMTSDTLVYDDQGKVTGVNYGIINTITVISSSDMVNWTDHGEIPVAGPDGIAKWAKNS